MMQAQPFERRFIKYTLDDGLSQSNILDIKQDAIGNTWIATADGVNVFDGKSFEVYKNNPSDSNTLANNLVYAVLPLNDGKVWAIDQEFVVNEIDPISKKVKRLNVLKIPNEGLYQVKQIYLANDGLIWITSNFGIIILDRNGKEVKKYQVENNFLPSNEITSLSFDNKYAWVATAAGLSRIQLNIEKASFFFINQTIFCCYSFKNTIYTSFFGNGNSYVLESNINFPEKGLDSFLFNETVVTIAAQKSGSIWFGTEDNGLYEKSGDQINHYKKNAQDKWSLVDNSVWTLYRDVNDDIWIGTISGLSIYKHAYNVFKLYRKMDDNNSLSSNKIYCIMQDSKSRIWMVTYDGELNMLANNQFTRYDVGNSIGLTSGHLRTIFESKNGNYYLGTFDKGMLQFFPEQKKFKPLQKNGEEYDQVRKIIQLDDHRLLVGHSIGISIYDINKNSFFNIDIGFNPVVYDMHLDGDNLFIATFGSGLLNYNLKTKKTIKYIHDDSKKSISSNNIMAMVKIHSDTLALGTYGGGISLFSIKNKSFLNFAETDGLANNSVYGILKDKKNNLWLSTNKGIAKWFSNRKNFKNYDISAQLQSLEFNEGAFLSAKNGMFYFGGVNGINFFNPELITINQIPPQAVFTQMTVNNKNYLFLDKVNTTEIIKLKSTQNSVKFYFKALRYAVPEKTKFYHQLKELESDWILASNDHTITYNNLPAGTYTLLLRACNEDDVFDEKPQTIQFTIAAPFYKTPWFIFLAAMLLIGVLLGIYRFRTNNLRKSYAAKMTDSELRALRIQMNPHFIFNSLNSIQYYVLNADSKTAYKYLTKFSSLMRRILQHSKENFLPLEEEISSLKLYLELENMRLENKLDIQFDVDKEINEKTTLIPTLFLQPFVENAIIHGLLPKEGPKQIIIKMLKTKKGFQCVIEDNGIGREKSKVLNEQRSRSHQSTALNAIENRIKILNESTNLKLSMTIEDLPIGTRVILNIE